MARIAQTGHFGALMALLSMAISVVGAIIPMTYCASINTATTNGNYSIYQSDGLCYDFCKDNYAFSVIQASYCWCTDYEPVTTTKVDTGKCNAQCPGYPDDTCGADGLWGYMALNKKPVGTKSADASASTRTGSSPSSSATPYVSVSVYTEGGATREKTVTVTPTNAPADSSVGEISAGHTGLNTGQAVGIAIGVLGFFVILAAIGVYFCLRRRKRAREAEIPSHQNSLRGSSAGMMSTPRTEMASVWDGDVQSASGRRNSRLMPHDPRMDPYSGNIYNRFENKSHESVNTLQDNHDYSRRVLRTTNPDPIDT